MSLKINQDKCLGVLDCTECIEVCPVFAIDNMLDSFEIDTNMCIDCYVCLYVCPVDAIREIT